MEHSSLLLSLLLLFCTSTLNDAFIGIRARVVSHRKTPLLVSASGAGGEQSEDTARKQPQMEAIPFDSFVEEFAKDDLPIEKVMGNLGLKEKNDKDRSTSKGGGTPRIAGEQSLEQRLQEAYRNNQNRPREDGWIENPDRPTGYGIPDEDDNEAEMIKQMADDMADGSYIPDGAPQSVGDEVVKFLKDTYVGSPYDSRKKQQARYVIRNITGISVAIGVVFTVIWYAFPGKFIYKADNRPAYRATTTTGNEYDGAPSGLMPGLMRDEYSDGGKVDSNGYIDEAAPPVPQTRFEYDAPRMMMNVPQAPKPALDL